MRRKGCSLSLLLLMMLKEKRSEMLIVEGRTDRLKGKGYV